MTRELISFWSACSETKFLDEAYSKLTTWLEQHPDSLLPLLFLNIGIDALKENEQIAFKFADDCIRIYFKREYSTTLKPNNYTLRVFQDELTVHGTRFYAGINLYFNNCPG